MNYRQFMQKSELIVGAVHDFRKIQKIIRRKKSSVIIKKYVASNQIRKLQIGAGPTLLPGWLSTDLLPRSDVVWLNAAEPFPIDDNTFDYIHSEHMIEHITWHQGMVMLKECRRILKPGGTIRIATPDLEKILSLYDDNITSIGKKYIRWITDRYLEGNSIYKAAFVINTAFTSWGHRFLYDGGLLEMALSEAGFVDIRRYSMGESDDENLRGIEMHGQYSGNEEAIAFETMVFEGK